MSRYARSEMILEENWEIFNPIASQRQVVVHLKLCAVVALHALCNRAIYIEAIMRNDMFHLPFFLC
jgi:hypothetical protein